MGFELDVQALQDTVSGAQPDLLDGKAVAAGVRGQVAGAVATLRARYDVTPTLVVVQVGDHEASEIYVRLKRADCRRVGIESVVERLPSDTSEEALHALLDALDARSDVDGVLLQLPLPAHLDPTDAIARVSASKDVDGFGRSNLGGLMSWRSALEPCTPRGVMTLFGTYGVVLRGARALVVGRSMIVGRPMAQMLMRADATVTVAHRHTRDLPGLVAQAEVLVCAAGVPGLIHGDWVRPESVVVDVGITRLEDGSLSGDVDYARARERARLITPVPGGVGPMTRATLLENTVRACMARRGLTL